MIRSVLIQREREGKSTLLFKKKKGKAKTSFHNSFVMKKINAK